MSARSAYDKLFGRPALASVRRPDFDIPTSGILRRYALTDSDGCEHETQLLRQKPMRNGQPMYLLQCQECGRGSSHIAHHLLTERQREHLPAFDEGLRDRFFERQQEERLAVVREREEAMRRERSEEYDRFVSRFRATYAPYLESKLWNAKRRSVLERDDYTCQVCLSAPATQVHHTEYNCAPDGTYQGGEPAHTLLSICDECHACYQGTKPLHDRLRQRFCRVYGVSGPAPARVPRDLPEGARLRSYPRAS